MRVPKIWKRRGRTGWWATIGGRQVNLGLDRKAAEQEFHRLRGGQARADHSRATVADLATLWLDHVRPILAATSIDTYERSMTSWLKFAGRLKAAELRPYHLTQWLDSYRGWSPSTKHGRAGVVKAWSSWCKSQGYLQANPLDGAKRPAMQRRKPVKPADLERVLKEIQSQAMKDFAYVLLDTGARPGEIRALQAAQIDWNRSCAVVRGKTGERLISLTARALDILRRYAEVYPTGPVLRGCYGQPWQDQTVRAQFSAASTRAGVRVTAYALRHSFWSRANAAGIGDITIAAQLGHKNLTMLLRHYANVTPEVLKDAVEKAAQSSENSKVG